MKQVFNIVIAIVALWGCSDSSVSPKTGNNLGASASIKIEAVSFDEASVTLAGAAHLMASKKLTFTFKTDDGWSEINGNSTKTVAADVEAEKFYPVSSSRYWSFDNKKISVSDYDTSGAATLTLQLTFEDDAAKNMKLITAHEDAALLLSNDFSSFALVRNKSGVLKSKNSSVLESALAYLDGKVIGALLDPDHMERFLLVGSNLKMVAVDVSTDKGQWFLITEGLNVDAEVDLLTGFVLFVEDLTADGHVLKDVHAYTKQGKLLVAKNAVSADAYRIYPLEEGAGLSQACKTALNTFKETMGVAVHETCMNCHGRISLTKYKIDGKNFSEEDDTFNREILLAFAGSDFTKLYNQFTNADGSQHPGGNQSRAISVDDYELWVAAEQACEQ